MKNRLWIYFFCFTILMIFIIPAFAAEKAAPKAAEKRRVEVKPRMAYRSAQEWIYPSHLL